MGRGLSFLLGSDMFCCNIILLLLFAAAVCAYISWYIVLQKRLVRDCETIVARDERGDYYRVGSV